MDMNFEIPQNPEEQLAAQARDAAAKEDLHRIIENLIEENEKLEGSNKVDVLTGAPNERAFRGEIAKKISEAAQPDRRGNKPNVFTLLFIDANGFKKINDTLGHAAGDHIIKEIAKYLRSLSRASDYVARLHGDEFVVIFDKATEKDIRGKFGGREGDIVLSFDTDYEGQILRVSLSGGLTQYRAGDTPDSLLERADKAMYETKAGHYAKTGEERRSASSAGG
jgi:diguanylate cyclase (GGDEF)-like protein